jgi:hypothetical protein
LHELKFAPNEDVWCQRPIKSGANRITQSSALVCPAPLVKSKVFAFTISFHIIYPSFTIGLAAWLTILEALHLATGRPAYRVVFDFWLKIFGVTFGMGVVSGIVMAFQFGTNWEVLARMTGPIQGVLLTYETFTAFFLEAGDFLDEGLFVWDAAIETLSGEDTEFGFSGKQDRTQSEALLHKLLGEKRIKEQCQSSLISGHMERLAPP